MDWIAEITQAEKRLGSDILRTPLLHSKCLSALNEGAVYLKLESEQHTGSFKARGALNKVRSLSAQQRQDGLLTASTGNHAQGFARAIELTGGSGTIFLPTTASQAKVDALRQYPVALEFHGAHALETELHAKSVAEQTGKHWLSPYNDEMVIAGQGTVGVEMLQQQAEFDYVLACVGGGGLMSGVASWFKHHSPTTTVVGCLPENSPEMALSVEKGEVVVIEEALDTLSDGSAGGLEEDSITFDLCRSLVDEFLLVSETQIAEAIRYMAHNHHKIIEGAAGVALAVFLNNLDRFAGARVGIVICGANISMDKFRDII